MDPDPHSFYLLDPDPHLEKLLDPDPLKMNADPQPWLKNETGSYFLVLPLGSAVSVRIRIRNAGLYASESEMAGFFFLIILSHYWYFFLFLFWSIIGIFTNFWNRVGT